MIKTYLINLLVNPFLYGFIFQLIACIGKNPKRRNAVYGYRTTRAMRSEEAFRFANGLFFPKFKKLSWQMVVMGSLFPVIVKSTHWNAVFGMVTVFLSFAVMIYQIEKKLKEKYG